MFKPNIYIENSGPITHCAKHSWKYLCMGK